MSAGGGSKRLFRKVGDQSSKFYPDVSEVRRDGSYIYEEFVVTQGTDVKVYTVGPDYAHAEARRSPVVDGKVKRDEEGIEIRYPVMLSAVEKEMCRKITIAFKQGVCGFDILRVQGPRSYVCDVNGWSAVKNSRKYYDDCAQILAEMMLTGCRPQQNHSKSILPANRKTSASVSGPSPTLLNHASNNSNLATVRRTASVSVAELHSNDMHIDGASVTSDAVTQDLAKDENEELHCIVAITRHGDRTPKQKMKVSVDDHRFISYYNHYSQNPKKELRIKAKTALVHFLEVTRQVTNDLEVVKGRTDLVYRRLRQIRDVLERWEISGINRKLQIKPQKWEEEIVNEEGESVMRVKELLLILKWGGDLTPMGRAQAEYLGAEFRKNMYPDLDGGGVLRLHSTYRHDLKIRSSDEGRVMKTAAAFTKGLLDLEGQLTPILVSLVTVEEKTKQMLDVHGNDEIAEDTERCKEHLNAIQIDSEVTEELLRHVAPAAQKSVRSALLRLGNPLRALRRVHALMKSLVCQLEEYAQLDTPPVELYVFETFDLMYERWSKLYKDFFDKKKEKFDLTKVPDVYDMARYDVLHNHHLHMDGIEELCELARDFSEAIVPQEYGIDKTDKRVIGCKACRALLEKIKFDITIGLSDTQHDMRYNLDPSHAEDLKINSLGRCVRTRLYFTSESHLHAILNVLRYPPQGQPCAISPEGQTILEETSELSYLTEIVIRIFSDKSDITSYRCEILFSPGSCTNTVTDKENTLAPFVMLNKSMPYEDLVSCLQSAIEADFSDEEDQRTILSDPAELDTDLDVDLIAAESRPSLISQHARRLSAVRHVTDGEETTSIDIVTEPSNKWEIESIHRRKSLP
eukprot:CAMPEP_0182439744 /NCGR_PEP_ID=MMETSP1167-20130531/86622_1 /TAXON_ID=2988 /ORGANISM="Mallomonas Sp, Strain CCMP3275" /LENGTH=857 /DNA_ID=CAMNT_0024633507 /DNA_START=2282 /DNA_END=4855 /DNA_ORIENTATION=+